MKPARYCAVPARLLHQQSQRLFRRKFFEWIEFEVVTRDLDRYVLEVRTPHETHVTPPEGTPISTFDTEAIRLFTNQKILGASRFGRRYS